MPMECSVYGKGVQLTLLHRRLRTEVLTPDQKRELMEAIEELERELEEG